MTIINTSPDRIIQIGYEGEDRVTVLRFRYGANWLENGEGIFHIRVRRHGETQAYNAQLVADDAENNCLLMTVTNVELSVKGSGEMQVVYSGEDFVKKSPIYSYNVSRAVDEAVDPPTEDVYTQIIESLSDLQMDVQGLSDAVEDIGDISLLTTEAKTDLVSAINEVNERGGGGGGSVTIDDALSTTSTNPVQNKVVTSAMQSKADTATVSALSDAVQGLDSDVQGLQTAVQSKADAATVTALSGTVSSLQTAVQGKANTTTVTALSNRVTSVETDKASHDEVDTVQDNLNLLGQVAQQYMEQTETALDNKTDVSAFNDLSDTVTGLQTSKADKSYVDTQLAGKASTATATASANGLMSAQDKSRLDAVYTDYTSALTALGGGS